MGEEHVFHFPHILTPPINIHQTQHLLQARVGTNRACHFERFRGQDPSILPNPYTLPISYAPTRPPINHLFCVPYASPRIGRLSFQLRLTSHAIWEIFRFEHFMD